MKIDSRLIAAALLAGAVHLAAAPLTETAAVQTLPDSGAPVITLLKAGTEPVLAPAPAEGIPAGWTAVQVSGPFEAYVRNADLTKQLEVRPGASLLLAPKATAGVLTVFAKGDQARITGLLGSWTQVSLDKTLVGYLHAAPSAVLPEMAAAPATTAPEAAGGATAGVSASAAGPATAPATAPTASPTPPSAAAPVASASDAAPAPPPVAGANSPVPGRAESTLPRFFEGQFVSSRRFLAPTRPYPWQLNDASGNRYAYLDVSHLLLTDQIENYAHHEVLVFGPMSALPGTKDLVIYVQSLRLR